MFNRIIGENKSINSWNCFGQYFEDNSRRTIDDLGYIVAELEVCDHSFFWLSGKSVHVLNDPNCFFCMCFKCQGSCSPTKLGCLT